MPRADAAFGRDSAQRRAVGRGGRGRYRRRMRWAISWDGARLVVVQRASRTTWFGVVATATMAVAWYPLLRGAGAWLVAGGTVLCAALTVALTVAIVRSYRRVEASEEVVQTRRWSVPASQVRVLTVRRETSWVSTRWGRGCLPIVKLFVGLVGGRTVELMSIDGTALGGRAGQALAAGLAALPYGRPPR